MPPKDGENNELNVNPEAPGDPAITEKAVKIADREAREAAEAAAAAQKLKKQREAERARAEERSTAFGDKTARYYRTVLKNIVDDLDEYFPENSSDTLWKQDLEVFRKEVADLLGAKTRNGRKKSADEAYSTLIHIDVKLGINHPGTDSVPIDANQMEKQKAYLGLLRRAVNDLGRARNDPEFGINDELYHNMSDRIREADDRITELKPLAEKDPKVVGLAMVAKQSLAKIQSTVGLLATQSLVTLQQALGIDAKELKEMEMASALNKLKEGKDFAGLYLYQLVNFYIAYSGREPSPNDSADRRKEIEEQKEAADIYLAELRGRDLATSIDQVKTDKAFQTINEELSIYWLNRIMMRPDGMLQAYREIEAERIQKYKELRNNLIEDAAKAERKTKEKFSDFERREREIDESEFDRLGLNEKEREEKRRDRAELQQKRRVKYENEQRDRLNEKLRKLDESELDRLGLNEKQREEMRREFAAHQKKEHEPDKKTTAKSPDVRKHNPPAGPGIK